MAWQHRASTPTYPPDAGEHAPLRPSREAFPTPISQDVQTPSINPSHRRSSRPASVGETAPKRPKPTKQGHQADCPAQDAASWRAESNQRATDTEIL
eukprot:4861006-Pleurochrysis_carterae.AAC.1